ncbi:MAG TPA: hypothetical protein VMV31_00295 [Terriglobales bacterium]|nr:hypothetical protein [Terriglobales bacterium]
MQTSLSGTAPPRLWLGHLGRAALVVLCIEIGLLLLTLPWMALWDHAFWVAHWRTSHPLWLRTLLSPYLRGAVSGLGLVNLWSATSEITRFRL